MLFLAFTGLFMRKMKISDVLFQSSKWEKGICGNGLFEIFSREMRNAFNYNIPYFLAKVEIEKFRNMPGGKLRNPLLYGYFKKQTRDRNELIH